MLVTGASGTVGREVARALRDRAEVRLALRDPASAGGLPGEPVRFDFSRPDTFGTALDGVEGVFLIRPPAMARASAFAPFLAAARAAGARRIAVLSVRGAESNPLLPHRRVEKAAEASGLAWTHLRPNDFMQNLLTVHRDDIRSLGEIWAPAGRGLASWIDVRDLGEAAARVLTEPDHEGRAYTLTGPKPLSFLTAAAYLSRHAGHAVRYVNPSVPAFLLRSRRAGKPLPLTLIMTAVYTAQRLGYAAVVTPDLERLLGRRAGTLAAFVRDHAEAWRLEPPMRSRGASGEPGTQTRQQSEE